MTYRAKPVEVEAFEIGHVGPEMVNGNRIVKLIGAGTAVATPEMLARYTPVEGDYWVIQGDGYEYVNPKAVFERKYSPVTE